MPLATLAMCVSSCSTINKLSVPCTLTVWSVWLDVIYWSQLLAWESNLTGLMSLHHLCLELLFILNPSNIYETSVHKLHYRDPTMITEVGIIINYKTAIIDLAAHTENIINSSQTYLSY